MEELSQKSKILFRPKRLEKKQRSKHKKIIFGALFLIFFLGVFGYVLFFSPIFKIKSLEVASIKQSRADLAKEIQDDIWNGLKNRNFFFLSESEIKNSILLKYPNVYDVKIVKNFAKAALTIDILVREMSAIWCKATPAAEGSVLEKMEISDGNTVLGQNLSTEIKRLTAPTSTDMTITEPEKIKECFYVDKSGTAFKSAPLTFGSLIVLVKDFTDSEIFLGKQAVKPGLIQFILEIKDWLDKNSDIVISEFRLAPNNENNELKGLTADGWQVVFNEAQTAAEQGFIIKKVLEEEIKDKRQNLEYLDLRLENRVYYKLKEMTND